MCLGISVWVYPWTKPSKHPYALLSYTTSSPCSQPHPKIFHYRSISYTAYPPTYANQFTFKYISRFYSKPFFLFHASIPSYGALINDYLLLYKPMSSLTFIPQSINSSYSNHFSIVINPVPLSFSTSPAFYTPKSDSAHCRHRPFSFTSPRIAAEIL